MQNRLKAVTRSHTRAWKILTVAITCMSVCVLPAQELINDATAMSKTPIAKPGYLETIVDPCFKTKITRITDVGPGATRIFKPLYSPVPAWNADESRILLWKREGEKHHLLDAKNFTDLGVIPIKPMDLEQVWWHPTDADLLFYSTNTNKLMAYNVKTKKDVVYCEFSQYKKIRVDSHFYIFSWDGKLIAFNGHKTNDEKSKDWVVFNMETKKIHAVKEDVTLPGYLLISPSGKYVLNSSTAVYDAKDFKLVQDFKLKLEHADVGMLDGEDYLVRVNFTDKPHGITSYRFSDGKVTPLFGGLYPIGSTHISCKAFKDQQWIYISSIGKGDGKKLFDNEIYRVKLDGSGSYERICHHRSRGKNFGVDKATGYFYEPHVTVNPSGTQAVFTSCWDKQDSADTYIVDFATKK